MAKISGENTEKFAERVVSDSDKNQINFAFEKIFNGLSLLEWMHDVVLWDAWKIALDELRDFVFAIPEKNYVVDYLRIAVFEYKKQALKNVQSSVHAYEKINYPKNKFPELEKSANENVQIGVEIIQKLVQKNATQNTVMPQHTIERNMERENQYTREREYERERNK